MDGSDPANDWHGFIPFEQNPTVKNPPRGFVSSANQSHQQIKLTRIILTGSLRPTNAASASTTASALCKKPP
jgi:acyl-homoserine lactone acylase PvdQ